MTSHDLTLVIHLLGFLTGIVLYAMLGVIALRSRAASGARHPLSRLDRIPLATSLLGLLWNCGALFIYGLRDLGTGPVSPWMAAIAFSALGFLPAVIVQSAAGTAARRSGSVHLVWAAYALSGVAALLQVRDALADGVAPSRMALVILTYGYGAVIAGLAVFMRGQPGWRRALSGVALAAFAVMALHLSQHTSMSDSLPLVLVGHHASLPLALVILYQDYRFALADLFLKRVLTIVGLIAFALALYLTIAEPFALPRLAVDPGDPRGTGIVLGLWIVTALAYPVLRTATHRFVDRVVLRRVDYARLREAIAAQVAVAESPEAVLDAVCTALAPALSARRVHWVAVDSRPDDVAGLTSGVRDGMPRSRIPVPTAEAPFFVIEIADLTGGRRLLSDDLTLLDSVALAAARRIDAVRMTQERIARELREKEILQLATEAELRALRTQLNPHFLFNALTTIGYLLREAPDRALETLYRLTGLLRAVLKRSDGTFTTLGDELEIVQSYLAIERARFEERLAVAIDVPTELRGCAIPPLVLQPLVENAIKHGIAPRATGGRVSVSACLGNGIPGSLEPSEVLCLSVSDTGLGISPTELLRRTASGIGLSNLQRRLERYYGDAAMLTVRSAPDVGTTVEIRLPIQRGDAARQPMAALA